MMCQKDICAEFPGMTNDFFCCIYCEVDLTNFTVSVADQKAGIVPTQLFRSRSQFIEDSKQFFNRHISNTS